MKAVNWDGRSLSLRVTLTIEQCLGLAFWLAGIAIGAAQAWTARFQPSTIDVVSYLDIGDAYVQGRWADAVNAYWNPLYSWILGAVMWALRPSDQFEYPVAKAVDWGIYLLCFGSFAWFLKGLRLAYRDAAGREEGVRPSIPDWAWVVGGYTLFIWSSIKWITLTSNTPDMVATALCYLAWGMLYRLERDEGYGRYVILGVVLALAYLARTPMFGVGIVILLLLARQTSTRRLRRQAAVAGLSFALLTTPFIASISKAHGHLTIGDNGKLNHAWLANPGAYIIPNRHWQGGPAGYGAPRHPSRLLLDRPAAFEFAEPIGGTYPPWTDPSYWYEGLRYHFDGAREWQSLVDNVRTYFSLFGGWWLLVVTVVMLLAGDLRSTAQAVRANFTYWGPAVTGLVLYLLANDLLVQWRPTPQPPSRYIAPFVVLLLVTTAFSLRFRPVALTPIVRWSLRLGVAVVSGGLITWLAANLSPVPEAPFTLPPWLIARSVEETGLTRGMRVAIIGSSADHEYWARLARVRIVADVPNQTMFWSSPPDVRRLVLRRLAQSGAEFVVASSMPEVARGDGWQPAGTASYAVLRLDHAIDRDINTQHPPAPASVE